MFPTHRGLSRNGLSIQITGYTHEVQYPVEKEIVIPRDRDLHHLVAQTAAGFQ
jgi:hypothetical protein